MDATLKLEQVRVEVLPTHTISIYIAGDYDVARAICREFCLEGLCVTVTHASYIYTLGEEPGVVVGLINYPRFPVKPEELWDTARRLGRALLEGLHQGSFTLVGSDKTEWVTRRPYDVR